MKMTSEFRNEYKLASVRTLKLLFFGFYIYLCLFVWIFFSVLGGSV